MNRRIRFNSIFSRSISFSEKKLYLQWSYHTLQMFKLCLYIDCSTQKTSDTSQMSKSFNMKKTYTNPTKESWIYIEQY